MWWQWVLVSVGGILAVWALLILVLLLARPETGTLRDGARILPDTLRLVRRLATDATVPRSTRCLLWGLLGYLALPIDLIPDFVPVLGWADDVILASLVLRHVIRRAGPETVRRHWPGTADGLSTLGELLVLPALRAAPPPSRGAEVKTLVSRHQPDEAWADELDDVRSLLEIDDRS